MQLHFNDFKQFFKNNNINDNDNFAMPNVNYIQSLFHEKFVLKKRSQHLRLKVL